MPSSRRLVSLRASEKHKVIFVLGGPGSGKGTQCAKLVKEFGFTHLSAGELLRAERQSGSKDGILIEEYIKEGKIVPVDVSLGLLKRAMDETPLTKPTCDKPFFLVDGFPRNRDNVQGWEKSMSDAAEVRCVLFMDCSEVEMERRLLSRGLTSGRTDDNLESARKRFRTYEAETLPVVEEFRKIGLLRHIAADRAADDVYEETRSAVSKLVANGQ